MQSSGNSSRNVTVYTTPYVSSGLYRPSPVSITVGLYRPTHQYVVGAEARYCPTFSGRSQRRVDLWKIKVKFIVRLSIISNNDAIPVIHQAPTAKLKQRKGNR